VPSSPIGALGCVMLVDRDTAALPDTAAISTDPSISELAAPIRRFAGPDQRPAAGLAVTVFATIPNGSTSDQTAMYRKVDRKTPKDQAHRIANRTTLGTHGCACRRSVYAPAPSGRGYHGARLQVSLMTMLLASQSALQVADGVRNTIWQKPRRQTINDLTSRSRGT